MPPMIVNQANPGESLVNHQDNISIIKKPNGKAIASIFNIFGTPTAKLKIKPMKKKMKLNGMGIWLQD